MIVLFIYIQKLFRGYSPFSRFNFNHSPKCVELYGTIMFKFIEYDIYFDIIHKYSLFSVIVFFIYFTGNVYMQLI